MHIHEIPRRAERRQERRRQRCSTRRASDRVLPDEATPSSPPTRNRIENGVRECQAVAICVLSDALTPCNRNTLGIHAPTSAPPRSIAEEVWLLCPSTMACSAIHPMASTRGDTYVCVWVSLCAHLFVCAYDACVTAWWCMHKRRPSALPSHGSLFRVRRAGQDDRAARFRT